MNEKFGNKLSLMAVGIRNMWLFLSKDAPSGYPVDNNNKKKKKKKKKKNQF